MVAGRGRDRGPPEAEVHRVLEREGPMVGGGLDPRWGGGWRQGREPWSGW